MAEHIQNTRPPRQPCGKGMIGALVKEQAGFLATHDIGHVDRTIHRHRQGCCRRLARQHIHAFFQTFQRTGPACAVHDHGCDTRHILQGRNQRRDQHVRPSGIRLHDSHIAKAVNNHTGQAICLCMDQAVKRVRINACPMRKGAGKFGSKPCLINHSIGVLVQHPADDLGHRINRNDAHRDAVGIFQQGDGPCRQTARAAVCHQFIGVYPRETVADCPRLCFGYQAHGGAVGRNGHGKFQFSPSRQTV